MLQSSSVSHLCLCSIWEGARPEHTPVPPTFSAEAARYISRDGAVGCISLVPELTDRRIAILGCIAAGTPRSE